MGEIKEYGTDITIHDYNKLEDSGNGTTFWPTMLLLIDMGLIEDPFELMEEIYRGTQ